MVGGAIVAFIRSKDYVFISSILNLYVSFTRGVPIVVQLLIGQALLPKVIETLCKLIGKEYQQQNFPILLVVLICYGSYQIVLFNWINNKSDTTKNCDSTVITNSISNCTKFIVKNCKITFCSFSNWLCGYNGRGKI